MLTDKEKEQWLKELSNLDGTVLLKCETHNFFPGVPSSKPKLGCQECALCEIFHQVATTPPHLRLELLDKMEAAIHHMCEAEARGEYFHMFEHPVITYERDVN